MADISLGGMIVTICSDFVVIVVVLFAAAVLIVRDVGHYCKKQATYLFLQLLKGH